MEKIETRISKEDLMKIKKANEDIKINCPNCNTELIIDKSELESIDSKSIEIKCSSCGKEGVLFGGLLKTK